MDLVLVCFTSVIPLPQVQYKDMLFNVQPLFTPSLFIPSGSSHHNTSLASIAMVNSGSCIVVPVLQPAKFLGVVL